MHKHAARRGAKVQNPGGDKSEGSTFLNELYMLANLDTDTFRPTCYRTSDIYLMFLNLLAPELFFFYFSTPVYKM